MNVLDSFQGLVFAGESASARQLRMQVGRMAPYFRSALLVGERGTGKADVARELHRMSPAAANEFRLAHAAAASDDDLLKAATGTLYLVHIERLTTSEQVSLLSRLNRIRSAETRLICASCCDLRGMVASGRMREDFHSRISGLEIRLAPLRERRMDFAPMLSGWSLGEGVQQRLDTYPWPGNIDELMQVLQRASSECGELTLHERHLPALAPIFNSQCDSQPGSQFSGQSNMEKLDVVMHRHVADVLERCAGNKLRAAEMLGISRSTLYRMLESPPPA